MWFKSILLDEPGVMTRKFFTTSAIPITIRSFCYFAEERFVDDDSVRSLMELFSMLYGADGRHLFIPPLILEGWRSNAHWANWEWEKKSMNGGKAEKVFAIVLMSQHWGAFCVDLTRRKIQFGDSLSRPIPNDAVSGVRGWLRLSGQDLRHWSSTVDKFDVPQQPITSGSCAIIAANTIECTLNPAIECWTHQRSAYHRTRYLKLLIGYVKVSYHTVGNKNRIANSDVSA